MYSATSCLTPIPHEGIGSATCSTSSSSASSASSPQTLAGAENGKCNVTTPPPRHNSEMIQHGVDCAGGPSGGYPALYHHHNQNFAGYEVLGAATATGLPSHHQALTTTNMHDSPPPSSLLTMGQSCYGGGHSHVYEAGAGPLSAAAAAAAACYAGHYAAAAATSWQAHYGNIAAVAAVTTSPTCNSMPTHGLSMGLSPATQVSSSAMHTGNESVSGDVAVESPPSPPHPHPHPSLQPLYSSGDGMNEDSIHNQSLGAQHHMTHGHVHPHHHHAYVSGLGGHQHIHHSQNHHLGHHGPGNASHMMDSAAARRKNATRETTNTLKAWLYEHRKNPYPTKGEKIMLAIITKMTLTQVSTWFANARRRLKKENKMTWEPRNKTNGDNHAGHSGANEHSNQEDKDSNESGSYKTTWTDTKVAVLGQGSSHHHGLHSLHSSVDEKLPHLVRPWAR